MKDSFLRGQGRFSEKNDADDGRIALDTLESVTEELRTEKSWSENKLPEKYGCLEEKTEDSGLFERDVGQVPQEKLLKSEMMNLKLTDDIEKKVGVSKPVCGYLGKNFSQPVTPSDEDKRQRFVLP